MASSGDLLADRRYGYAEAALAEGDADAAADLARQSIELAPDFAPGWFLLGKALLAQLPSDADGRLARKEAIAAFRAALRHDPTDELGAALQLALLGEGDPGRAMSAAYVRALFDEYAIRFDRQLRQSLAYRGPEVLRDAVRRACSLRLRPFRFDRALDLGCGTGLAGEVFRDVCATLAGIDLSPAMVRRAQAKRIYDDLAAGDLFDWLAGQSAASADLALAADVLVYLGDLRPVFDAAARALRPGGLLAFTVQAHAGEDFALGADHRFAHGEAYLRGLAAGAKLVPVVLESASTRLDRGVPVPGLVAVLSREAERARGLNAPQLM